MIKAVFWDNDGVLVDTEHLYFEASREALQQVGIELSLEQFVRLTLNEGRSPLVLASAQGIGEEDIDELRRRKNQRYSELLQGGAAPMAGVAETLAALHGKVLMAIVTSSRRDHFNLIHRRNGLLGFFDFILTREDYRHSKPDPEPYLKALQLSGLKPVDCLVVEDTRRGLAAARQAELRCVIIPNRLAPGNEFDGACRIIRDPRELPPLILPQPGADASTSLIA